jgi:Tfp pilus assembly protein PilF
MRRSQTARSRALVAVVFVAAVGCAARPPSRMSDYLIKQGNPAVDFGGPPLDADPAASVAALRQKAIDALPKGKVVASAEAEVTDPRLRQRLEALKAAPSAAAHRDVALEYRRMGVLDAAYDHLSSAIRLDDQDASAYDLRARIWRTWKMSALGIADARKAVELEPRSAPAWNTLGLLLEDSAEPDGAGRALLTALTFEEEAPYAWVNLCRLWTRAGSVFAADVCRSALRLNPDSKPVRANLQRAERIVGAQRLVSPASQLEQRAGVEP